MWILNSWLLREMPEPDLKNPAWKRRARSWDRPGQLHQLETLMAALNIHCCRWVWVWVNSLINECKLRTKQPKGSKIVCRESPKCISYCAGWELLLSPMYWLKALVLIQSKPSKFLILFFAPPPLFFKKNNVLELREYFIERINIIPYFKKQCFHNF